MSTKIGSWSSDSHWLGKLNARNDKPNDVQYNVGVAYEFCRIKMAFTTTAVESGHLH